jgi:hypothetical protein
LSWSRVAELVEQTAAACRRQAEQRLLRELHRYLRRLMTVQNTTSNLVYVVTLQDEPLEWSDLTFRHYVESEVASSRPKYCFDCSLHSSRAEWALLDRAAWET